MMYGFSFQLEVEVYIFSDPSQFFLITLTMKT